MTKENAHLFLPLVQALADGKNMEYLSGGEWIKTTTPSFTQAPSQYRIKPEPVMVPLEATNVPPGSVVRSKCWVNHGGFATPSVFRGALSWPSGSTNTSISYDELMANGWQINRSIPETGKWDSTAWHPCSKEAPRHD